MQHHSTWSFPTLFATLFATSLSAQNQDPNGDALQQARARLQKAIAAVAQLPSCGFDAKWGPNADGTPQNQNAQVVVFGGGGSSAGEAKVSWTETGMHCRFEDTADELVSVGRRTIAREGAGAWTLRRDRFADGRSVAFTPDAQQLFTLLQQWDLPVTHREVGTLHDRPIEILTTMLTADQTAELLWSGLLPAGGGASAVFGRAMVRAVAIGGAGAGGAKPAMPKPEGTVDLAFFVDPSTSQVHQLKVRVWQKDDMVGGARAFRFNVGGGGAVQVVGAGGAGDDDDAEDKKAEAQKAENKAAAKAGIPEFTDGLPGRPRKNMSVTDLSFTFHDQGTAKGPELDAAAKALLGLK
ncbi:MAG TPA: hypothetical protein VK348_13680 [Planctomycetota bacterium]|nr:hypothetical protein [Planctomycetota bacterium]